MKATTLDSGKVALKTPFSRDFVDDLKDAVDWLDRDWNPAEAPKCWVVSAECGDTAVAIAQSYWPEFVDGREMSDEMIMIAEHRAEMSRREGMQAALIANQEAVEAKLEELKAYISQFSYRSRSRNKWAALSEKGLLEYAMEYARKDPLDLAGKEIATMVKALDEMEIDWEACREQDEVE